ncbi:O-antigen ligase [Bradyrhizobium sp. USDA 4449]
MDILRRWSEIVSLILLCFAVAVSPLPFGSTEPWVAACWVVVLGAALLLAPVGELTRGRKLLIGVFAIFFACELLLVYAQTCAPFVWMVGAADPIWPETSRLLHVPLSDVITAAQGRPWAALSGSLVALLALACGFILGARAANVRTLLKVVAWAGVFYAVLGMVSFFVDPSRILGREKEAYRTVLTATFINRNTAAAYFGVCAVVWLLFLCESIRPRGTESRLGDLIMQALRRPRRRTMVSSVMLFILCSAMFMTGSRAGTLLSLAALLATFIGFFRANLVSGRRDLLALLWVALLIFVLLQVMGTAISARIEEQGLTDQGRWEAYKSAIAIVRAHPWLGTGLGTFALVFPQFRSGNISAWGTWDRAHNTLLELADEGGLPLAVLVVLGWSIMLMVLLYGARRERPVSGVASACLAIATLSMLHSLVDFPLQIPGFSMSVFSLMGAGLAHSLGEGGLDAFPGKRGRERHKT